jgi:tRNA-splicing ligase RtcB (3'-phosphate/5'-hydroxy nucleic acid ligase)
MKKKELIELGIPASCCDEAISCVVKMAKAGISRYLMIGQLKYIADYPELHKEGVFSSFARKLIETKNNPNIFRKRETPAPYKIWGENLEEKAVQQLIVSCDLPISKQAALMPDAHLGYGLPIGGVLATKNAVIPYAVGVDIACRMKMTVLDIPPDIIDTNPERLIDAINKETYFGVGGSFHSKRQHDVMDEDWSVSPVTKNGKDKAWSQLGTSGGGNHFLDIGILTLDKSELGLSAGSYLAILTHSGSRGIGAAVCSHYFKLAKKLNTDIPDELKNLSWLSLDSEEGNEYWEAMNLMGNYASANHACIHRHMVENLGCEVLASIENHHNFAWKEKHDGEETIVHRKGATPAHLGELGIIPGSMATPGYVVRGLGNKESLNSASHGAGRKMSRTKAKEILSWNDTKKLLAENKITLLSAGLDESPGSYKDIDEVMNCQTDLVETIARFDPRIVKMADAGETPED